MDTDTRAASTRTARFGFAFIGVLLIAVNLRVSFVSVGPVLDNISSDLELTSAAAGFLTGLPLIAFAVFSPVAPAFASRVGLDRALWFSLLILAAGIILRSLPIPGLIWVGTALIGTAIAFLNVLVPSLVKRDFPNRVSQVTGSYTATQAAFAALGAAVVVPVAQTSPAGWRLALGIWAGLALIALAVLLPWLRRHAANRPAQRQGEAAYRSPWKSALGWQVTLFMGLQSIAFYVLMAWLPTIEQSRGVSAATAGVHLSVFLLVSVFASLGAGALLHRGSDQRLIAVVTSALTFVTFAGLALAPALTLLWVLAGAVGCGFLIVIALSLFSLRTVNYPQAAALSGMAQSVGYGLGAAGPVLFGALRDLSGDWTLPLLTTAVIMIALCVAAWLAGRNRVIGA
ncbi:CP family cyanate transporter-like MFS transporter [Arthrobacter pigmenti]|uniref:CP family cyanate transporter-like MFS transporter n=1 Tax=Arthrobacter pigmenti TaxID=271432 RepID=A0A846RWK0_9MICC|nr:MFS transporter [Arthrobacter pigmenti]NJC22611.1 CP family cyanate transporter-like MFS transporter [Arthrobacter pigmenti]